nr:MauE/DoxX family redox-associated membrane protein [Acidipropionibacterium timonense]
MTAVQAALPGLTFCAVFAAVVLVVSAVAKMRSDESLAAVMDSLGLPGSSLPAWFVPLLPWAEVVLAVALLVLPGVAGVVAASLVTALFIAYTVVVVRVLRTIPDPVDCHCFGDLAPGDVTGSTIARNLVFVVLGGLSVVAAAVDPRPAVVRACLTMTTTWSWWLAAVLAVVATALILHRSADDADGGSGEGGDGDYVPVPTPLAAVTDREGRRRTLRELSSRRPVLLLFVSTGCGFCAEVIEKAVGWVTLLPEVDIRCVLGPTAGVDSLPIELQELALVDEDGGARDVFEVRGFPTAWLLGVDQQVAGGPQAGPSNIETMVGDMRASLDEAAVEAERLRAGQSAIEIG